MPLVFLLGWWPNPGPLILGKGAPSSPLHPLVTMPSGRSGASLAAQTGGRDVYSHKCVRRHDGARFLGRAACGVARAPQGRRQRRAEAHRSRAASALDGRRARVDPLEAQIRQVFFFDTPELALNGAGVVVRARRIQGKGGDSIMKLRPVTPSELPDDLRRSDAFRVEVDALPGGFVCSGTLKGAPGPGRRTPRVEGSGRCGSSSRRSSAGITRRTRRKGIDARRPDRLGPIFVLKTRFTPAELGRPLVGEMWLYPDGSRDARALDSLRHGEAFEVAIETRAFLAGHGVDLSGEQETKTSKALEYFARERAEDDVRAAQRDAARRDRAALGVAHVRRELRRGRRTPRRHGDRAGRRKATRSTCSRSRATPR